MTTIASKAAELMQKVSEDTPFNLANDFINFTNTAKSVVPQKVSPAVSTDPVLAAYTPVDVSLGRAMDQAGVKNTIGGGLLGGASGAALGASLRGWLDKNKAIRKAMKDGGYNPANRIDATQLTSGNAVDLANGDPRSIRINQSFSPHSLAAGIPIKSELNMPGLGGQQPLRVPATVSGGKFVNKNGVPFFEAKVVPPEGFAQGTLRVPATPDPVVPKSGFRKFTAGTAGGAVGTAAGVALPTIINYLANKIKASRKPTMDEVNLNP